MYMYTHHKIQVHESNTDYKIIHTITNVLIQEKQTCNAKCQDNTENAMENFTRATLKGR